MLLMQIVDSSRCAKDFAVYSARIAFALAPAMDLAFFGSAVPLPTSPRRKSGSSRSVIASPGSKPCATYASSQPSLKFCAGSTLSAVSTSAAPNFTGGACSL